MEANVFEPLLNLGKLSNNLDMNFMLEKFNELAQNLNENAKNYVRLKLTSGPVLPRGSICFFA